MFPNLEAEQARKRHTNAYVSEQLGISRQMYERKKKTGAFKLPEIQKLLDMYDVEYKYLFYQDSTETAS